MFKHKKCLINMNKDGKIYWGGGGGGGVYLCL